MPARYWVGSGTWDSTSTANWSATSTTGATGASVPTAADDVIFDASSGACTLSTTGTRACRSVTMTGYTNTLTLAVGTGAWNIGDASGGQFVLSSGMTLTNSGSWTISLVATSTNGGAGWTVNTAGRTIPGTFQFNGAGGKWRLAGPFTSSGILTLAAGEFDTNSQNLSLVNYISTGTGTKTLTLRSSAISCSGSWTMRPTGTTVTANTATLTVAGNFENDHIGGCDYNGMSVVHTGFTGTVTVAGGLAVTVKDYTCTGPANVNGVLNIGAQLTCTGTFTVNGNSLTNRMLVRATSGTSGTELLSSRAVIVDNATFTNTDFMDIALIKTSDVTGTAITSDSFNRANGALGSTDAAAGGSSLPWTNLTNSMSISSNTAIGTAGSGTQLRSIAVVDAGTSNQYVETKLASMANARAQGIVAALVDDQNYVWAEVGNASGTANNGSFGYVLNGAGVTLRSGNQIDGSPGFVTGDTVGILVSGRVAALFRNGVRVTAYFNVPLAASSGTKAGIFTSTPGSSPAVDDFRVNALTSFSGTSVGDCLGNSGITFTTNSGTPRDGGGAGVKRYAVAAGNFSSTSMWSETDGGSPGASVPLPQDDVFLTANSAAGTYTVDLLRVCRNFDATGFTRTLSFVSGNDQRNFYGSFVNPNTGFTWPSINTLIFNFRGRSSHTIALPAILGSNRQVIFTAPNGTYTAQNGNFPGSIQVAAGTFVTNNQTISTSNVAVVSGATCDLGSSVMTLSVDNSNQVNNRVLNVASGGTLLAQNATVNVSGQANGKGMTNSTGQRITLGTLNYTQDNNQQPFDIIGPWYFNTLNVAEGRTITFPASTTTRVGTLNVVAADTVGFRPPRGAVRLPGVSGNYLSFPEWRTPPALSVSGASSDVVINVGGTNYRVVTWLGPGSINVPSGLLYAEYLVVAGGGGGGGSSAVTNSGGGGGAGGLLTNVGGVLLGLSGVSSITVGTGGAGGTTAGTTGSSGSGSTIGTVISALGGGGGGGGFGPAAGLSGGSGGGGGSTFSGSGGSAGGAGTSGQGFKGGDATNGSSTDNSAGGGGGGAGAAAVNASTSNSPSPGGAGLANVITGTSLFYAGGGGGGLRNGSTSGGAGGGGAGGGPAGAVAGTDGLGGGGGAGGGGSTGRAGGSGGSGIVILRWVV